MDYLRGRGFSTGHEPAIRRDLSAARAAYDGNDLESSRKAHNLVGKVGEQAHEDRQALERGRLSSAGVMDSPLLAPSPISAQPLSSERSDRADGFTTPYSPSGGSRTPVAAEKSVMKQSPCVSEPGHDATESSVGKSALSAAADGTATVVTLFILAAVIDISVEKTMKLVWAGILALGVAAGVREYARFTAERSHFNRERARERWELDNFPRGEEGEMVELYTSRGVAYADAMVAITALSKYPEFFVDLMMVQELGLALPDSQPWQNACAAACAFLGASGFTALTTAVITRCMDIQHINDAVFNVAVPGVQGGAWVLPIIPVWVIASALALLACMTSLLVPSRVKLRVYAMLTMGILTSAATCCYMGAGKAAAA